MKIYEGYILVSEITQKANKSCAWLHTCKNVLVESIGGTSVVKVSSLLPEYQDMAKECQDLRLYYPAAAFSTEIGRGSNYISVTNFQRKKAGHPGFEIKTIGGHSLIKLSEEFIELVEEGLTPYKLDIVFNSSDYKKIIQMQNIHIGFY